MNRFNFTLSTTSGESLNNHERMMSALNEVKAIQKGLANRAERARPAFDKRKQLLPRERLNALIDPGTPFLEIGALAGYKMHDDEDGTGAGGGTIAGLGIVEGRLAAIIVSNSAVKGGAIAPMGLKKTLRMQEIAQKQKLPLITLQESAGANLLHQAEVFIEGAKVFANQARLSAQGVCQITVVHGSSTAGGAYIPGLSDYVIMVRGQGKIFLAGPPLLRAATGEIVDDETLGGTRVHAEQAGTVEYVAEDDAHGIAIARDIVKNLAVWPKFPEFWLQKICEPQLSPEELSYIVPFDYKKPYDAREVIGRIVDDSSTLPFKEDFDAFTICESAELWGMPVGIIANNGPLTPRGSMKAAQFIQLCNQAKTPLIFLQNTTGYMVGTIAESDGIVKHGSKMLQAVASSHVPCLTLVIGGSFGAGNYGMCGRGLDPNFIFAWPNARTSVMGPEQAAKVMVQVMGAKNKKSGRQISEEELSAMEMQIKSRMEKESTALYSTARLWDDGIIDPRDSRKVLGFLLHVCKYSDSIQLEPTTFGVARF